MMSILYIAFIILEVVVLFNLIIIAHELGHFLAAKWRGLVVERFGIWFGKPLWEKKIKGVRYSLGTIPFGGFVALPQMAPMEMAEGQSEYTRESLPQASVKDRIIVAFAGPLFSFLCAVFCALIIWVVGRPVGEADTSTVIGYVGADSPAKEAGLKVGDEILSVGGHRVTKFMGFGDSVKWQIINSKTDSLPIQFKRDGEVMTINVTPETPKTAALERDALPQIGVLPRKTPVVAKVFDNSPAAEAGIQPNDAFLALNGEELYHPQPISAFLDKHGKKPLNLTVERGEKVLDVSIKPEVPIKPEGSTNARIGVAWDLKGRWQVDHPGPIEQVRSSLNAMASTLTALFSSKSGVNVEHLSGPVGIMRIYYQLFQSEHGWRLAIWFSVILNVNLAILNLLPFPVLDGGHITLALIEGISRRPINVRVLQYIQGAFVILLFGFMLYITIFDIQDFGSSGKPPPGQMEFAPKK